MLCSRTFWQLIAVGAVALPTSMIRKMDSLKHISALAMLFILSFSLMVVGRGIWVLNDTSLREENWRSTDDDAQTYWSDRTCRDHYHDGCYKIDYPGDSIRWFRLGPGMLKALPILCFAFLCHQNMFPVLDELENATINRISRVSRYTMLSCISMYFAVGTFGYLTFLESVSPNRSKFLTLVSSPRCIYLTVE